MCIMSWQTLPVQGLLLSGPGSQAACRVSVGTRSREGRKEGEKWGIKRRQK